MFRHRCCVKPKRYFKISRLIGESVCFGMHRFFRRIRLILAFGAKECAKIFFSHRPHIYTHRDSYISERRQQLLGNKKHGLTKNRAHKGITQKLVSQCVCVELFYLWPWCCPNNFLAFQSKHIHFFEIYIHDLYVQSCNASS